MRHHDYYATVVPAHFWLYVSLMVAAIVFALVVNGWGERATRPRVYDWARECDFPLRGNARPVAREELRARTILQGLGTGNVIPLPARNDTGPHLDRGVL